jgi:hypothetical protein
MNVPSVHTFVFSGQIPVFKPSSVTAAQERSAKLLIKQIMSHFLVQLN